MCGFCGYVDSGKIDDESIIQGMNRSLIKRGPNAQNVYVDGNVAIGHTRLSIIDITLGSQPMIKYFNDNKFVIAYNGEIYNTADLRDDLISRGHVFSTTSDTEVVLSSYIEFGDECVNYLNGIFSFVIFDKQRNRIFFARDRLGIKPLFYATINDKFIFASEIKSILEHPDVTPILDKDGIMELIGLGPAHTPGRTYFKNILEIKAGHIGVFENSKFSTKKYWDLTTKDCLVSEDEAIDEIHYLVCDATRRQLVSDVGVCTMLSGGLDSSILTKITNDYVPNITTFSINFLGNDNDFKANSYQMTKDSDYVKIMKDFLKTNHKTIEIENTCLFDLLENSMIARDMPGMADIDSSMFAFCNKISDNGFKVCISGECSDEIFGGYPWFYKEHLFYHDGFPWALSENLRTDILKDDIFNKNDLKEYVTSKRIETLKNVVYNSNDDFENRYRDINYLTIKWFMNTLLERTDRMSMANSLEVRVPFADHRIFEYVYNLPAKMKLGLSKSNNTPIEKFLLRKAFEKELPNDVVYRKKSPFPKTYDPKYLKLVENKLEMILEDKTSPIHKIINSDFVMNLIKSHGETLTENLFGQLMTYPQTLAYLIQVNMWLEKYKPTIQL